MGGVEAGATSGRQWVAKSGRSRRAQGHEGGASGTGLPADPGPPQRRTMRNPATDRAAALRPRWAGATAVMRFHQLAPTRRVRGNRSRAPGSVNNRHRRCLRASSRAVGRAAQLARCLLHAGRRSACDSRPGFASHWATGSWTPREGKGRRLAIMGLVTRAPGRTPATFAAWPRRPGPAQLRSSFCISRRA